VELNDSTIVVFDIDGTLIDTSKSYGTLITKTAELYIQTYFQANFPVNNDFFKKKFIEIIKSKSGFNSDFDCVSVLIAYYLFLNERYFKPITSLEISKIKTINNIELSKFNTFKTFNEFFNLLFGGPTLSPMEKLKLLDKYNLIKNQGSFEENIIEQMFQELYYGRNKYMKIYNKTPTYYKNEGYYQNETLMIDKNLLKRICKNVKHMGILTGRPKSDLVLGLERFQIQNYFNNNLIVDLDDCLKLDNYQSGKYTKPHTYGLLKILSRVDCDQVIMIGDSIDDMLVLENVKNYYKKNEHIDIKNLDFEINEYYFNRSIKWKNILIDPNNSKDFGQTLTLNSWSNFVDYFQLDD
jgi:phosphoglycolate phosphatase-like HAD superfamily hydrolase